jgi:flap endonuclease-1
MGIQGLAKLIADQAPAAIKEIDIKNFFGRKIAIDASALCKICYPFER